MHERPGPMMTEHDRPTRAGGPAFPGMAFAEHYFPPAVPLPQK